jgi:hypothetical protein
MKASAGGIESPLLFLGRNVPGDRSALVIDTSQKQFMAIQIHQLRIMVELGNDLATQKPKTARVPVDSGIREFGPS